MRDSHVVSCSAVRATREAARGWRSQGVRPVSCGFMLAVRLCGEAFVSLPFPRNVECSSFREAGVKSPNGGQTGLSSCRLCTYWLVDLGQVTSPL